MKNAFSPTRERGQAIVLIVFAMVAMLGLLALAMDGGQIFADRRQAQNAADAAAMAAALARVSGNDLMAAAFIRAESNGYPNNGARSTVIVEHPPVDGAYGCTVKPVACQDYIQVKITSHVKTWFAQIVGVSNIDNNVVAVARAKKKVSAPFYNGSALVALSPDICKAFYFSGSANTTISGSGIFVNSACATGVSTNPQQAFYSSGDAVASARWVRVVGGAYYRQSDLNLEQPLATGMKQYPTIREAYDLPAPICGGAGNVDEVDLSVAHPGGYTGGFPPDGVTHLEPGIYCVENLKIKNDLSGSDILIVVTGGVRMNSNATISLHAKRQGPNAGLLIYMPPAHHQPIYINGSSALELTGLILAPSSDITINGTGSSDRFHSQVIGNTISLSGDVDMHIVYEDEENYDPTTPPEVSLVK